VAWRFDVAGNSGGGSFMSGVGEDMAEGVYFLTAN